jgi:hypothetical protein
VVVERVFGLLNEQSRDLADGVDWMTESESVHDLHVIKSQSRLREGKLDGDAAYPRTACADRQRTLNRHDLSVEHCDGDVRSGYIPM